MVLSLFILMLAAGEICTGVTALSQQKQTLVIGLNPALQRTVTLSSSLQVGSVNRGSSVQVGIGGKGQDVIVAGVSMKAAPSPLLLQFLGSGAEGDALANLLHTLSPLGSDELSVRTSAACRTCVTLVDPVKGEATEIVEPSGTILPSEITAMLSSLEIQFKTHKVGGVAVMGSMPPGCSSDLYAQILKQVCDSESKVLFDTATGIFESLAVCGDLNCDAVIKLNARELCKLAGLAGLTGAEASCATPVSLIQEACALLGSKIPHIGTGSKGRVYVAVTDGPYASSLTQHNTRTAINRFSTHLHCSEISLNHESELSTALPRCLAKKLFFISKMDESGDRVIDISVGPKVERFYLSYRNAAENIHEVMESMYELEHHIPNAILGETSDVIIEIVSDCQKKTAQVIRAPVADNVRGIITSIRKKLVSKVSRDADSSTQHGQRHLNSLLELLGTWSNAVDHIRSSHWGISATVFRLIISQLHERVIEMALECFLKFREDKQLDGWHVRIMEAATAKGTSAGDFSIIALDFLLSQMSAMRDIVQQYYKFLGRAFLSISIDNQSSSANFITSGGAPGDNDYNTEIDLESTVEAHMELVVSAQEKNKWRELDAVYIALEFGYLSNSIKEALSEPGLLEVEKGVFVPQAIEDVFFLLQRVVERALATGNESSAFSVGNYIVELLDPTQESKVYELLSVRHTYRGCFASRLIQIEERSRDNIHSRSPPHSINNRNSSNNNLAPSASVSTKSDTPGSSVPHPLSHSSSASLLTGVAVASFSGMNNWLKGLAEPTQTAPHSNDGPPHTRGDDRTDTPHSIVKISSNVSRNSMTPPLSSSKSVMQSGTLESLLLSALDLDLGDLDQKGGRIAETVPLGLKDVGVHLTTLALAPGAILILGQLFNPNPNPTLCGGNDINNSKVGNSSSGAGGSVNVNGNNTGDTGEAGGGGKAVKKSPLNLISEELTRCGLRYAELLKTESTALAMGVYQNYVSSVLISTLSRPYDINGEIMDRRTGDFELLRVLRDLIPDPSYLIHAEETEIKSKLNNTTTTGSSGTEQKENKGGERERSSVDPTTATENTKKNLNSAIFESEIDALARRTLSVKNLLGNRMSSAARTEVLLQLALLLNINILESLMKMSFSEWGALLLHQEVLTLVRLFDEICDESAGWKNVSGAVRNQSTPLLLSAKDAFAPVIWALKLLTLDQPADIRKYSIPQIVTCSDQNENSSLGLLTENKMRKIMGRRLDFSKEAVFNVKIVIK